MGNKNLQLTMNKTESKSEAKSSKASSSKMPAASKKADPYPLMKLVNPKKVVDTKKKNQNAKKDSSKKMDADPKKLSLDAEKLACSIADLNITEEVFKDDKETRQKRKEKRNRESLEEALRVFEPSKQFLDPIQRKNMTEEDKEVE